MKTTVTFENNFYQMKVVRLLTIYVVENDYLFDRLILFIFYLCCD